MYDGLQTTNLVVALLDFPLSWCVRRLDHCASPLKSSSSLFALATEFGSPSLDFSTQELDFASGLCFTSTRVFQAFFQLLYKFFQLLQLHCYSLDIFTTRRILAQLFL